MTDLRDDLTPDAGEDLVHLAERLLDDRPVPAGAFRGRLRRRLLSDGPRLARPPRLHALIGASAGGGALLLTVGAISAAGVGPLGG